MNIYEVLMSKDSNNPLLAGYKSSQIKSQENGEPIETRTTASFKSNEPVTIEEALRFVGKKMAKSYRQGNVSVSELLQSYNKNRKEAETFCTFGYRIQELQQVMNTTHNPALKAKLSELVTEKVTLRKKSNAQNQITLAKLGNFMSDVLGMGIGLRRVISLMRKLAKRTGDTDIQIVSLLLETEFANVNAKRLAKDMRKWAYKRKVILLSRLSGLLAKKGWRFGYNNATGKNASFLTFVYLPNGVQLTWHCNEYTIPQYFDYIDDEWDGQVCMTLEKILIYIKEQYSSLLLGNIKIAA